MAAGAHRYTKSETNPNDSIGGGGCFCSDGRCEDRGGPYFVSQTGETDNNLSPYMVVCAPCVLGMAEAIDDGSEAHTLGEPTQVLDAEAVEIVGPERHENPVAEGDWPALDDDDDLAI